MRVLMIGNPISGGGLAAERLRELEQILQHRGHDVEVFLTRQAGDAARRAEAISDDARCERLVVVGGDGTLNEVLNGLQDPSRIPLLQMPTGTANLLARELRAPWGPDGVADLLENGRVKRLDVGYAGRHRFLMVVSAGIDAAVVRAVHASRSGTLGMHKYVLPLLRTIREWRTPHMRVRVNGQEATGAVVIASNIQTYAGYFRMAKDARVDSGTLEVVVFPRDDAAALTQYLIAGWRGRVAEQRGVQCLRGTEIEIDADRPVPIEIDGDDRGTTPIALHLRPKQLAMVVPR